MERHSRSYFRLIKPGITLSNTITGIAGFLLAASVVSFQFAPLVGAIIGIALIIASACVVNNVLDRDIDKRMKRTATRDVASGDISIIKALTFASILGLVGFAAILVLTNPLTFTLGVIAYVWYVAVYGLAKRITVYSTIIGSVAGALPPVAGYTALTGNIDAAAVILFLVLFFWQIPHFYAIAMFRRSDYASARLPIWSVTYGMTSTKKQIMITTVLYVVTALLLTLYGYTGLVYLVISLGLSAYWLGSGIFYYNKLDDIKWARKMFGASLLVLLAISVLIAVGGYLP